MLFKIYLCMDNLGEQSFIFCPLANISLKAKHQSPKSEKQSCCTPARREHIWTVLRLGKPVFLSYLSAVSNRHDEGEASSKPSHACLNPRSHTCVPKGLYPWLPFQEKKELVRKETSNQGRKSHFSLFLIPFPLYFLKFLNLFYFLFKFNWPS